MCVYVCVCEDVTWTCPCLQAKEPKRGSASGVSSLSVEKIPFHAMFTCGPPCFYWLYQMLLPEKNLPSSTVRLGTFVICARKAQKLCLCHRRVAIQPGNHARKSCLTKTQSLEETLSGKSGNTLHLPVHFIRPCVDHSKEGW